MLAANGLVATLAVIASIQGPEAIRLRYEDSAPAFDGLSIGEPAGVDAPLERRTEGGLGLLLIKSFATNLRYAREDGRTRWWIELPRRP